MKLGTPLCDGLQYCDVLVTGYVDKSPQKGLLLYLSVIGVFSVCDVYQPEVASVELPSLGV